VVALFGYDFLLTAAGRPVLVEVNANPMLSPNNGWRANLPVPLTLPLTLTLTRCSRPTTTGALNLPLPLTLTLTLTLTVTRCSRPTTAGALLFLRQP